MFDSSGEPASRPEVIGYGVPCSSGTEFVVGCSKSEEDGVGASTGASMEVPSSLWDHCALYWQIGDHLLCSPFPGAADGVLCFSGTGDVSTEAEVRYKRREKRAVISRRFVPLSGRQPLPIEFGSHEWSRELLDQAFDDGDIVPLNLC